MIRIWKHSRLDSFLFALTVLQFCAMNVWAVYFEAAPWFVNVGCGAGVLLLMFHNYSISSHEFVHLPWFQWNWMNRLYSLFNSINLGTPMCIYRHVHFGHHRFNNNAGDPTSTYRYGKRGRQEHWIKYSALGLFRSELLYALGQIRRKNEWTLLWRQSLAVLAMFVFWTWVSWRFFLFGYLPVFFGAQFLSRASNYFGHYNATDVTNPYADSVCHYGKLWNLIMFNEGYHQEHHIRPQGHWSERPQVRSDCSEKMTDADTYVESIPSLIALNLKTNPLQDEARSAEKPT